MKWELVRPSKPSESNTCTRMIGLCSSYVPLVWNTPGKMRYGRGCQRYRPPAYSSSRLGKIALMIMHVYLFFRMILRHVEPMSCELESSRRRLLMKPIIWRVEMPKDRRAWYRFWQQPNAVSWSAEHLCWRDLLKFSIFSRFCVLIFLEASLLFHSDTVLQSKADSEWTTQDEVVLLNCTMCWIETSWCADWRQMSCMSCPQREDRKFK